MTWDVRFTSDVESWLDELTVKQPDSAEQVVAAIDVLARVGPTLGRPLVDRIKGSQLTNLKELRPGSTGRSELRVLFIFDPERRAVLLVAGNKAGNWSGWYRKAIPLAERLYAEHLKSGA